MGMTDAFVQDYVNHGTTWDWKAHYDKVRQRIAGKPQPNVVSAKLVGRDVEEKIKAVEPPKKIDFVVPPFMPQKIPVAKQVFEVVEGVSLPHTPRLVFQYVASKHKVTLKELVGQSRQQHICRARQEIFWRLHEIGAYTLHQIGYWMGGRDHTTVLHGVRMHRERIGERAMPSCSRDHHSLARARGVMVTPLV